MRSPPGHTAPFGHDTQREPVPHAQSDAASAHTPSAGSVHEPGPNGHGSLVCVAVGDACAVADSLVVTLADAVTLTDAVTDGVAPALVEYAGDGDVSSDDDGARDTLAVTLGDAVTLADAVTDGVLPALPEYTGDGDALGDSDRDGALLAAVLSEDVTLKDAATGLAVRAPDTVAE